jgi:hypothetical protein
VARQTTDLAAAPQGSVGADTTFIRRVGPIAAVKRRPRRATIEYQVLTLRGDRIVLIQDFLDRGEALDAIGP